MIKRIIPLLALSFVLAGCAVTAQQDGVMEAQNRKGGFMGLSSNDTVEVQTEAAFKERRKVVIGGFKVGFNDSKRMANKAGGGLMGGGFGGKSTGLVKLEGVTDTERQAITDAAYKDFVAALEAQGYTVVPRSELTADKDFAGAKSYSFPYAVDDSGFLSEYGTATYYSPAAIGAEQPVFAGDIAGMTGGFGFSNPAVAAAKYGEQTGIAVLNVSYLVDFAGAGGHGGKFSATSSLKVGQLLSVDQGRLGLTAGQMGTFSTAVGAMTLGQPVPSAQEFATIEETSTGADKGIETATNIASALLGGGTNQTRKFVYRADAGKFKVAAIDALKDANGRFVGKMVALR